MNTNVEKLENSMVKLTIEVDEAKFEEGIQKAYIKNRSKISVPGFRKGRVPRKLIEKTYGAGIFYEDAANAIIPDAYDEAVAESGLEVMSRPEIDVTQIESGKPFIFTAEVAVKPEVTLGDYKGLEVEVEKAEVTEDDVKAELDRVLEQNSRLVDVTDRAVEMGDQVVIDFEGFVNDEAFEGGQGSDYDLTIGSGSFIDTFEEQLVGASVGGHVTVNVTFPEEYHSEALKGQPARFEVDVKGIKTKELPALDDEFAQDVSEFDTLDEYKADLEKSILDRKESAAKQEKQQKVMEAAIANASMDLPDPMIDLEAENMTYEFAQRLQSQGMNMDDYFKYTGQNINTLKDQMKVQAEDRIKSRLVLEAVAAAEGLSVSEEDYDAEIAKMAEMYNMELDKLKESLGAEEKDSITQDMLNQKAVDLIVDAAVEK